MSDPWKQGSMIKVCNDFYMDSNQKLGKGNYGTVYKGYKLSTNQIIAVKFLPSELVFRNKYYEREIQILQDLTKLNHKNIMGYYGYQKKNQGVYFFIQLCNGGTLTKLIKEQNKVSELKVLELFDQILQAMTYINKQNIIHRDLKPDNLLFDQSGQLKICDFGTARELGKNMTEGICTPLYASPEVLKFQQYDQKGDVWSVGLILYEMLTGQVFYLGVKNLQQLAKFIHNLQTNCEIKIPQQLHPQWKKILQKMLVYNFKKRPSFNEIRNYFKSVQHKIKNDLILKYQQPNGPQHSTSCLKITQSVSVYGFDNSNFNSQQRNPFSKMAQKLRDQNSFTRVNNLRKWLDFSRLKTQMMVKLIRMFNQNQYIYIKNVYKYVLMFLSVSAYVDKMMSYDNEIKAKKINTPQGVISWQDISSKHQYQFKNILSMSSTCIDQLLLQYKQIVQNQIIDKIVGKYMKKTDDSKIISSYHLQNMINQVQKSHYMKSKEYMELYRKVADCQKVHFEAASIKELSLQDLKVYAYIRIIACLDEIFSNANYKNEDYVHSKKQQIENATKEQIIQLILKYNQTL